MFAGQQLRPRTGQVLAQPLAGHFAKGHQALFGAFAQHAQDVVVQTQVQGAQVHQLAHPQAAGVHQLQHGAVAHTHGGGHVGRSQQGFDLRFRQACGHPQRLLGSLEFERGVARNAPLAQCPAEVAFQDRETAVGGGGFGGGVLGRKIGQQIGLGTGQQGCSFAKGQQLVQVAAVGLQRVARQAFFQPQGVDERIHRLVAGGPHGTTRHGHFQSSCSLADSTTFL